MASKPQPISQPSGLLKKEGVRISEQESYRLNESLMRKRIESTKVSDPTRDTADSDVASPKELVSQEELDEAWALYCDGLRANNNRSLLATLTSEKPVLEGTMIEFKIANIVQEKDMEIARAELMEFLRTKLQNYSLDLNVSLNQQVESKMKFLTERDKYDKMVEKNPALEDLRKRLDLDLRM